MAVDDENQRATCYAVLRWLEIKRQWEASLGATEVPTEADVDHSALLARLLSGKDPLPEPPPTAYSSPWYELIEDIFHAHLVMDVTFHPEGDLVAVEPGEATHVTLGQSERFRIIEPRERDWVLAYRSWRFVLWLDTRGGRWSRMRAGWIVRAPDMEELNDKTRPGAARAR